MKKSEIVKIFRKKGFLLEPKLLDFLSKNTEKIEYLLSLIDKKRIKRKILSLQLLGVSEKEIHFKILKEFDQSKEFTTNDILKSIVSRYQKLREVLSKRMELVNLTSMNKISPRLRKFSVIGMIREKDYDTNSLILEDLTGEIEIKIKNFDFLVEDEVIGVFCERMGDRIYAKKIIFPEIPTYRKITRSENEIETIFLTPKTFSKIKVKELISPNRKIIVLGKAEKLTKNKNTIIDFSLVKDPSLIEIDRVKILLTKGIFFEIYEKEFNTDRINTVIQLLRKRHLNPKIDPKTFDDKFFLLDIIPDIIVFEGPTSEFKNYKGITLISCSKNSMISVNLKTRDVSKVDL
jgi:DNA polymerase II small subunit/DNA polymerase delta subunit B